MIGINILWILLSTIFIQKEIAASEMMDLMECLDSISKRLYSLNDSVWKRNIGILDEEREAINSIFKKSVESSRQHILRIHTGNKYSSCCFKLAYLKKNYELHKSNYGIDKCYDEYLKELDRIINPANERGRLLMEAVGRIVIGYNSGREPTRLQQCGNIALHIESYIHEQEMAISDCINCVQSNLRKSLLDSEDEMEGCMRRNTTRCTSGYRCKSFPIPRRRWYSQNEYFIG